MRFRPNVARHTFRLFPLSILLATSIYALGFWTCSPCDRVAAEDLDAASDHVRKHWQAHDVLAWRPLWAQQVRQKLGDLTFAQVKDLEREDLSQYARLWLLRWPTAEAPGGPFADGRYQLQEEHDFGRLRLQRYELGPAVKPLYDLRERLRDAKVRIHARGGLRDCARWVEQRWICSPQHWGYVGQVIIEIGSDPREMVWAHPISDGPTEIIYPALPHGSRLRFATGITPAAARVADGEPIFISLHLDGKLLRRIEQPNANGLLVHDFDLRGLGPGPHELRLFIETKNVSMRHLCYRGEVLP